MLLVAYHSNAICIGGFRSSAFGAKPHVLIIKLDTDSVMVISFGASESSATEELLSNHTVEQ